MLKIAVAQTSPAFLDIARNYQSALELIGSVDADLYLFPELFLSGYTFSTHEEVARGALEQDNFYFDGFKKLSQERGIAICGGYAEVEGHGALPGGPRAREAAARPAETFYNSSFFIAEGKLKAHYRKTHLFFRETQFFAPGNSGFSVVEYHGTRFGMMICFDWIFPEAARSLALLGAQVILHPSNLVLPYCQRAMYARAVENRVFVVTANRVGSESNTQGDELTFTGASQVVAPNGEYLLCFSETEAAVRSIDIDPTVADNKALNQFNTLFEDRRPEMYSL
ncbi:MAG: nitrilase-related carbon-nitrogen hydrolase [Spirochaetota bacterium]